MSNEIKDRLLGQSFGAASNRLRKTILYSMLYGKVYDRNCFRCGHKIEDVDDLSIEHKEPWQSANDPKAAFFDLENIAFSHLRCNCGAANLAKDCCPAGHPYDEENTYYWPDGGRKCRKCEKDYNQSDKGRLRNERFRQMNRGKLARKEWERYTTRRGAEVAR